MDQDISIRISKNLSITEKSVVHCLQLLDEGATIPFISRYRKERTGGLDEVQIASIAELYTAYTELNKRKKTILETIQTQNALTAELEDRIRTCWIPSELEDLYLPYKPKRKTRADQAKALGLEPLAGWLMKQYPEDPFLRAERFCTEEVGDAEAALKGARDIIAEWVNETPRARDIVRKHFRRSGLLSAKLVKGKESEAAVYSDYFDFKQLLSKCSSHRFLAINRANSEGLLKMDIRPEKEEDCILDLNRVFIRTNHASAIQVEQAIKDAYKRLMKPSIETEFAAEAKQRADDEAIRVFVSNLKQLLLAAPLGEKRVLGIDPGYRTGCKVVCLDAQGKMLHNETIYPHAPQKEYKQAAKKLTSLVEAYKIEAIAIGNGTASRETEQFVTGLRYDHAIQVFVVSENGASIYSASKIARDEFPQYDVTVRGAISIGRRLMDPLAELVKIDPKSLGVGQYQHDVDADKLQKSLDQTVELCVNQVGVNLNTASPYLLRYVSGMNAGLAQRVVDYRNENGPFATRSELLNVSRLGAKTFEQAAGFLRIPNGTHPLDHTAVHPERYALVEKMAADRSCSITDLLSDAALRASIPIETYVNDEVGLPTLRDIMSELEKPGRDPRKQVAVIEFDARIRSIDDVQTGMILDGIVTNITAFGCFVDIGVKENGLVHISEIANEFVKNPADKVRLHQPVKVKVLEVDRSRKRIQLSMKDV
ncbi:MAG: Tex family protein [Bacteroidales bacterium]|nr:Tex family protein [Bacteroidales bacterium]MDD4770632.1 Tex family protein [Bacteroidales bacterium]